MAKTEYWLRGPLPEYPVLVQPVAHALLQAVDEIADLLIDFDTSKLWIKPNGMASVGFHLEHITGVMDRLFTYAAGEQLTEVQLQYLKQEGVEKPGTTKEDLLVALKRQLDLCLSSLKNTAPEKLAEVRYVGRKLIPSTMIGLFVHTAEHTMRHTGQLLVTVKCLPNM
ncbi:MAG: DinB family protein [Chitinophagaceae bacterium]|nr:DinB family protein [Chitinophagaceae bacterium]